MNDNKMSISHNVGAMSRAFTRLRNQPKYHYFKFKVTNLLEKIPFIGSGICKIIYKVKKVIKSFVYKNNIFEKNNSLFSNDKFVSLCSRVWETYFKI